MGSILLIMKKVTLGARLITVLALAAGLCVAVGSATAQAAPSAHRLIGKGLDSCTAPSRSQMTAFWNNTPYVYWGIYIGGSTRGCAQPNLTASWVRDVTNQGWKLLPIWVGPQNPCQPGQGAYFSRNASTAYQQGKNEALLAYRALIALGMAAYSPIDYDLESSGGYNSSTCISATKSFIQGWVNQLHVAPAQIAGVYGSTCASFLDQFATLRPPPDFIDGAAWDGRTSTSVMPCIASSHWANHQRHKQYRGGHDESWNGVRLNVDSRCANSVAVGNAAFVSSSTACL